MKLTNTLIIYQFIFCVTILAPACKETKPSELSTISNQGGSSAGVPFHLSIFKEDLGPATYRIELAGLRTEAEPKISLPRGWTLDSEIPRITAPADATYIKSGDAIRLQVTMRLLPIKSQTSTDSINTGRTQNIGSTDPKVTTTLPLQDNDTGISSSSSISTSNQISQDTDQQNETNSEASNNADAAKYCGTKEQNPSGIIFLHNYSESIVCDAILAEASTLDTSSSSSSNTSTATSTETSLTTSTKSSWDSETY